MGALALLLSLGGCAKQIGDSCQSAFDCSSQGERDCDISQPGGYCTIQGCDPDTCPDGARCVRWRGFLARTAQRWCMQSCGKDSDCRGDYTCRAAVDIRDNDGQVLAEVLDSGRAEAKFCIAGPRDAP
ncbi:MAG: hypothetical protein ACPGUV_03290 [Polyangiales bacterium]